MKTINKLFILPLLLFAAVSCSNDDDRTSVAGITAPVATSAQHDTSIVLLRETQDDTAFTITWTDATYTQPTDVTYTIEAAKAGTEFDSIIIVGRSTTGSLAVTGRALNEIAVSAGFVALQQGSLDVRVTASLGTANMAALTSNTITINVTPFPTENPKIYLRGNFTNASGYGPDWGDNTTPPFLEADATGDINKYEGFIYMNVAAPEFKIIPTDVGFDGDYGDAAASGASGVLVQEGETNIKPGAAGYYYIQADLGELTYSATPTTWGIIGNATPGGWENSTPMTYDAATKKWTLTATMTAQTAPADGWKFRANNAWTYNLGDAVTNQTSGELTFGGSNIGIAATGTYTITLDLSNPRAYTYTIVRQ